MSSEVKRDKKVHIKNERFYYGNDKYSPERSINRHIGTRITDSEAVLIRAYIAERQAINHIEENRARKLATSLTGMRRFITVPYDLMTTEDVIAGIAACKKGHAEKFRRLPGGAMTTYDAGPLSPNSIMDFIKITKQFIGWLNEAKRGTDNQINERRLKGATRGIEGAGKTPYDPKDLFTVGEVNAMIMEAKTIRDKAFISTLFEAHARVGEIGRMVWADLDFSNLDYVEGKVWDSKAKCYRYPTFVDSREFLISLRNDYKHGKPAGNAFVFMTDNGKPITLIASKKILIRAAEKVIASAPTPDEIRAETEMLAKENKTRAPTPGETLANKPYWKTHNMRHSSATISLNDEHMRTEDLCQLMWGKNYSPHVETYVNRSEKQLRKAQLKAKGVKEQDPEPERAPWRCPKCKTLNSKDRLYCPKCGRAVDENAEANRQSMKDEIDADPDFQRKIDIAKLLFSDNNGADIKRKLAAVEEIFKSAKA